MGHPYVFAREVHLVVSIPARGLCAFAYIDACLLYSGTSKVPCRCRWCGSASNLQYSPK